MFDPQTVLPLETNTDIFFNTEHPFDFQQPIAYKEGSLELEIPSLDHPTEHSGSEHCQHQHSAGEHDPLTGPPIEDHQHDHHQHEHHHKPDPLLGVADFDGNGIVDRQDLKAVIDHKQNGEYHPIYDRNADGKLTGKDIALTAKDLGKSSSLLDQQIAQATQATMRYYGPEGLQNAIQDGFVPFTPELKGHGIHYFQPEIGLNPQYHNRTAVDVTEPFGLNFDENGNLIAVFYLRIPKTIGGTQENPFGTLVLDPADDFPPITSFDGLSTEDWHSHINAWFTGLGSFDSENVTFEQDLDFETEILPRVNQIEGQFFPLSDQLYAWKFWMLHGWFHSLNVDGPFAMTNPAISPDAPDEHGGHEEEMPMMA